MHLEDSWLCWVPGTKRPRVKDEGEPELQVTREPAPRGQMLVISVHYYSAPLRLRVTNVFTTVMAKMTACQSWQYFSGNKKMLEYWLTGLKLFLLCVAMHEDKQTAFPLYFPFYSSRQNKCKKVLVENLSASFICFYFAHHSIIPKLFSDKHLFL